LALHGALIHAALAAELAVLGRAHGLPSWPTETSGSPGRNLAGLLLHASAPAFAGTRITHWN